MNVIRLTEKFSKFNDLWSPKLIAELNGQHVKLAKIKGDFDWHKHDDEDELFMVIKGQMEIELKDKTLMLKEGEILVIPKAVWHKPRATQECWILLFEPAGTRNTGKLQNKRTINNLDWI